MGLSGAIMDDFANSHITPIEPPDIGVTATLYPHPVISWFDKQTNEFLKSLLAMSTPHFSSFDHAGIFFPSHDGRHCFLLVPRGT